jgi:lipopolysaccharide transport system ATP-binding protein
MKRAEIDRKFDEIVAFSEIERFIDTPVKHYSSGMYLRLAFAVAAHLEAEILLVDEVLAVGDAEFQKKCLGKMGDVVKDGRTILFVSHNLAAVSALCRRSLLLDSGSIIADGSTQTVLDQYIQTMDKMANTPLAERVDEIGNETLKFTEFELRDSHGQPIPRAYSGQNVSIALTYQSSTDKILKDVYVYIVVNDNKFSEPLFQLSTILSGSDFKEIPSSGIILCNIPRLPLRPGRYHCSLFGKVGSKNTNWIPYAGALEVEAGDFFGSGKLPLPDKGPLLVSHSWSATSNLDQGSIVKPLQDAITRQHVA